MGDCVHTRAIRHGNEIVKYTLLGLFTLVFACCFTLSFAYAGQDSRVFLWRVISEKNTVYMLGSVHVLKKSAYPLDERIEKAYSDSGCIMFETDMKEVAMPATRLKMIASGTYQDGTRLEQHISGKTYDLLKEKVRDAGMSMERFDTLKPWLCAVTLSGTELKRMGFDPVFGIESHFFTRAQQDKKDLMFLESPDYQIDLISGALGDRPEDLLKQTIAELEVIETMSADMLNAWESGDAGRMESIVSMSLKDYPRIHDTLFVQRNTDWTAQIEKLMGGDKNVLVIVGAGHLVGTKGVLAQLKARGYPVVQQ
ncbi:MAG: TraB/GumN family protein [Deltaproteobacteria bacterium]|nr:TraB/GumN family protein [Deltaproteobacteria bacterium]